MGYLGESRHIWKKQFCLAKNKSTFFVVFFCCFLNLELNKYFNIELQLFCLISQGKSYGSKLCFSNNRAVAKYPYKTGHNIQHKHTHKHTIKTAINAL